MAFVKSIPVYVPSATEVQFIKGAHGEDPGMHNHLIGEKSQYLELGMDIPLRSKATISTALNSNGSLRPAHIRYRGGVGDY